MYINMKKAKYKHNDLPVLIKKDESGYYFGVVSGVQGCHAQAKTLPLLRKRLNEAYQLCVEVSENEFCEEFLSSIELSEANCRAGHMKKLKSLKQLSK